jgi:IclR family acetate operon transcriptional repressor
LPEAEFELYLSETERRAFSPATITDADALRAEIATIRKTGIARTREEHTPGIQGIGCAVTIDGELLGAFSVAIPSVRFDAEVEHHAAELLKRTVALLEAA